MYECCVRLNLFIFNVIWFVKFKIYRNCDKKIEKFFIIVDKCIIIF